ncbi:MAG: FAD-linked oxidase, partial [Oxalobacteraceae bacterium]
GLQASAYGHLGDGNLHINLLCASPEQRQASQAVRRALYQFAVQRGGTISGEHGIGLAKRAALQIEMSAVQLAAQRRVKAAFDPTGLMNPGKSYAAQPVSG